MARRVITGRMILQMHRLFRCGNSLHEIATAVGCERRTVSRYVNEEVEISPKLQSAIDSLQWYAEPSRPTRRKAPRGYVTMREAARLMPTTPSQQFMRDLIHAGRLEGARIDGMLLTRQSWVDRYIRSTYGKLPAVVAIAMTMAPMTMSPSPSLLACQEWLEGSAFQVGRMPCVPIAVLHDVAVSRGLESLIQPISATRCRVLWRIAEIERALTGSL